MTEKEIFYAAVVFAAAVVVFVTFIRRERSVSVRIKRERKRPEK